MDIWPLQAARAQRETSSILSRVAGAEGLAARAARAAEGRRPDPALSRTAQKRRAAAVARAVLAANGVVVPEVDERPFFRVSAILVCRCDGCNELPQARHCCSGRSSWTCCRHSLGLQ